MHYWTWFGARSNILKTIYLPFAMELLLFKFTKSYYDSFWHTFTQFGYVIVPLYMTVFLLWIPIDLAKICLVVLFEERIKVSLLKESM